MIATVNIDHLLYWAVKWVRGRGYGESRILDVMHLKATETLKCTHTAAIDRFMRRNARRFNLVYIDYYMGIP